MGIFFGKNRRLHTRITEQDKAILQLKQQRDKLKQYQKRIELSLEKDRELAKKCVKSGRKEQAKLMLRKKKYQEKLLQNTYNQLENLEKLAADIEFAQVEQQVLDGLKSGNAALSKVHEVLNINEVEKILDETRESVEKQREIDEILAGTLTKQEEDMIIEELHVIVSQEESEPRIVHSELIDDVSKNLPEVPIYSPSKQNVEQKLVSKRALVEA